MMGTEWVNSAQHEEWFTWRIKTN